ncbi:hypothetical protein EAO77_30880 [Streptomyces sp. t39]|nr:hypothetical protein EAO77_30880 [Streptomyces sp. t39]
MLLGPSTFRPRRTGPGRRCPVRARVRDGGTVPLGGAYLLNRARAHPLIPELPEVVRGRDAHPVGYVTRRRSQPRRAAAYRRCLSRRQCGSSGAYRSVSEAVSEA